MTKHDRRPLYGELAIPAVHAGGGRILARGLPSKIYEAGMNERVTLIEFHSLEQAIAAREGAAYEAAFGKLGNVIRDVRVIEAQIRQPDLPFGHESVYRQIAASRIAVSMNLSVNRARSWSRVPRDIVEEVGFARDSPVEGDGVLEKSGFVRKGTAAPLAAAPEHQRRAARLL